MGIEPTSEAWEASIKVQNVRIGGNLTFFEFLKWIPIGAASKRTFARLGHQTDRRAGDYALFQPTL